MNLLLLPDGRVGEEVLQFLIEKHFSDIGLVVATSDNSIMAMARDAGLNGRLFQDSLDLANFIENEGLKFDLGLTAWWPSIIKQPLISLPRLGFVNCHPSLLPYCRGRHYYFWAIVEEAPFGVSIHFVDESVDSGDIIVQRPIAYDWTDTGQTLYIKAEREIIELFKDVYATLRSLDIPRKPQDLAAGSLHFGAQLDAASRIYLDRQYSARELLNLLRGRTTFPEYPACRFEDQGKTYEVRISIKEVNQGQ